MTVLHAETTGSIWKIPVSVGDDVSQDDVLVIIESMKMEVPTEAPSAGRVAEIFVAEGDVVEEGQPLVRLA